MSPNLCPLSGVRNNGICDLDEGANLQKPPQLELGLKGFGPTARHSLSACQKCTPLILQRNRYLKDANQQAPKASTTLTNNYIGEG